ncbi:MAG: methionyl-tRNA formyltransferase [Clostridia bacterium]|nr:methionyl-tRNA formyltransferase [Clostridia bacterium]
MKIVFMGTPDFAVQTLEKCIEHHNVVGVFTQPDKPKGRGKKVSPTPVKITAEEHDINVYQPDKIRKSEWVKLVKALNPDVIVVVAYGQILSQEILDVPKFGCINVHASLLPKYRGAAPINWAIANGEKFSGITTMQMDSGLDTGDMLLKCKVEIKDDMNAGELHDLLAAKGSELLIETLTAIENGEIVPISQIDEESSYASMLNKELALIDWNMSAVMIYNRIRGFNPWPVAHTKYKNETLKIFRAKPIEEFPVEGSNHMAGKVLSNEKTGIYVMTGNGVLLIEELQLGSLKKMSAHAFLLGHEIEIGTVLGEMEA